MRHVSPLSATIRSYLDNLLYSLSTLLFMKSKFLGIMLIIALCFNTTIAIHGLVAWICALMIAHFIAICIG